MSELFDRVMGSSEVKAWLIEDPGHPGKFWLPNRRTGTDWTDDANKAVRFLRHNDANEVIAARPDMNELWVAREHIWMGYAPPPGDGALRERLLIMQSARAVRDFCKHEGYPEEYSAKWQELTSLVDRLDMDFRRLDAALGRPAQTQEKA